jgi:hypothetical protein
VTDHFRCILPNRRYSAFLALFGLGFAALGFTGAPPGEAILFYASTLLFAVLGVFFLLAAVFPGWFMLGVALSGTGFELRRPLRLRRIIPFDSILQVQAVARGNGGGGADVAWRIRSTSGTVWIKHGLAGRSGLLQALHSRLPMDREAERAAHRHKPRGVEFLFGRRFTVYRLTK